MSVEARRGIDRRHVEARGTLHDDETLDVGRREPAVEDFPENILAVHLQSLVRSELVPGDRNDLAGFLLLRREGKRQLFPERDGFVARIGPDPAVLMGCMADGFDEVLKVG